MKVSEGAVGPSAETGGGRAAQLGGPSSCIESGGGCEPLVERERADRAVATPESSEHMHMCDPGTRGADAPDPPWVGATEPSLGVGARDHQDWGTTQGGQAEVPPTSEDLIGAPPVATPPALGADGDGSLIVRELDTG